MNILVIGNGFDLAHGLPTRYTDFLEFCKQIFEIYDVTKNRGATLYERECLSDWDINYEIKEKLIYIYSSRRITVKGNEIQIETAVSKLSEMYTLIKDNIWIEYFLQCNMYHKENWIDFESEISNIIQSLENDLYSSSNNQSIDDDIKKLSNEFLRTRYPLNIIRRILYVKVVTYKSVRNRLLGDLNRLIRAIEIYLYEYVEKIRIKTKSPDIVALEINRVLSFNYTHTFSRLYKIVNEIDKSDVELFDFIHGEANINNAIESNNMVLGIDEYLPEDRKDKDIEFIAFKKYYQRIYKGTGCKYKDWINEIREENDIYMARKHDCEISLKNGYGLSNEIEKMRAELKQLNENPPRHSLYIFGHSLDITDKDILRDLILNNNVYTTIFYPDKEELGRKIANLVKVIGQDELIRRTGGSAKTIEFKLQQPMVPIDN